MNLSESLPRPAILRLCTLFQLLADMQREGVRRVSSEELGKCLGVAPHNLRKDISHLGESGTTGAGYETAKLKDKIGHALGLGRVRTVCIVGLGRIGSAILGGGLFTNDEFRIVAGFDSNINRIETIATAVPVYPAYQIPDVVRRVGIELAVIAVPQSVAQETADRLAEGGIKGIINFASVNIHSRDGNVMVRNIDIQSELRILAALIELGGGAQPH